MKLSNCPTISVAQGVYQKINQCKLRPTSQTASSVYPFFWRLPEFSPKTVKYQLNIFQASVILIYYQVRRAMAPNTIKTNFLIGKTIGKSGYL